MKNTLVNTEVFLGEDTEVRRYGDAVMVSVPLEGSVTLYAPNDDAAAALVAALRACTSPGRTNGRVYAAVHLEQTFTWDRKVRGGRTRASQSADERVVVYETV